MPQRKYFHVFQVENGWMIDQRSPLNKMRQYVAEDEAAVLRILTRVMGESDDEGYKLKWQKEQP